MPGCPDYAFLASAQAQKLMRETCDKLCIRAKQKQTTIEKIAIKTADEATLRAILTIDSEIDPLFCFLTNYNLTDGSDQTRANLEYAQAKVLALRDGILMSKKIVALLQRILHRSIGRPEQCYSATFALETATRAGALLNPAKQSKLKHINQKLAKYEERFANNVIDSKQTFSHHIEEESLLGNMPQAEKEHARTEAKKRNVSGFVFTLSEPSLRAIMRYCTDRRVRKIFYDAQNAVARKSPCDNRRLILKILKLRQRKAKLLGYETFADFTLINRMAKNVKSVRAFIETLAKHAKEKAREEIQNLEAYAKSSLQRWDISFYEESLLREHFAINQNELAEYFADDRVIEGMFVIMEQLYDVTFQQLPVKSYHPDVRTYEVRRRKNIIGYLLIDLYARPQKKAGAWCEALRSRMKKVDDSLQLPVIVCSLNATKTPSGPRLLSHDDVETFFHECGHAMHFLLSENDEANTSALFTQWDVVELPSQLMENWLWHEPALHIVSQHITTKNPLPSPLVKALENSRMLHTGITTLGQCAYTMLDLELHHRTPPKSIRELDAWCKRMLRKYAVLPVPENASFHQTFCHIFSGGYAAGYYSYLWSQMLEADVYAACKKTGLLHPRTGERLRKTILSQGNKKRGSELLKDFLGRNPDPKAMLRKKNLIEGTQKPSLDARKNRVQKEKNA